jgi:hypothetical protein
LKSLNRDAYLYTTPHSVVRAEMDTLSMPPEYTDTEGAARFTGVSAGTLATMRVRGGGPPYSRTSPRIVRYSYADLRAWLEASKRLSTSAA